MTSNGAEGSFIPIAEARRQVSLVCRRLGLLHLAFAEALVRELGRERGMETVARAIKEYAKKIGERKRELALEQGLELTPESFFKLSDLPAMGMHDRIEEVDVEGEKRIRAHGCVMGRVWRENGKDDLGRPYCWVDPASTMTFNPAFKLVHTKALPDGDPFCELVIRPTTEGDRAEFEKENTAWAAVDVDSGRS